MATVVRDGFETLRERPVGAAADVTEVGDWIRVGESQTLEFKSAARWNLHTKQVDKKIEHQIAKTVCGFLNAEGGVLLIGVSDDGAVLGLDNAFSTLGKSDRDGYELFLHQKIDVSLSAPTAGIVRIRFETHAGADVCVVSVAASAKPVFAKPLGGSDYTDFWVRTGNQTKQLHGDDMLTYQTNNWG